MEYGPRPAARARGARRAVWTVAERRVDVVAGTPKGSSAGRSVDLLATIDGHVRARARVRFDDGGGAHAGRAVTLLQWDTQR